MVTGAGNGKLIGTVSFVCQSRFTLATIDVSIESPNISNGYVTIHDDLPFKMLFDEHSKGFSFLDREEQQKYKIG